MIKTKHCNITHNITVTESRFSCSFLRSWMKSRVILTVDEESGGQQGQSPVAGAHDCHTGAEESSDPKTAAERTEGTAKLSATRSYNALLPQWRGPHGETSALKTPRAWSGEIKPRVRQWWGWKQRVISASRDAPLTAADATLHSTRRVMKSTCTLANLENWIELVNCEINKTKIPNAYAFTANDTGGSKHFWRLLRTLSNVLSVT